MGRKIEAKSYNGSSNSQQRRNNNSCNNGYRSTFIIPPRGELVELSPAPASVQQVSATLLVS